MAFFISHESGIKIFLKLSIHKYPKSIVTKPFIIIKISFIDFALDQNFLIILDLSCLIKLELSTLHMSYQIRFIDYKSFIPLFVFDFILDHSWHVMYSKIFFFHIKFEYFIGKVKRIHDKFWLVKQKVGQRIFIQICLIRLVFICFIWKN